MKKTILAILSGLVISSSFAGEITNDSNNDWYAVPSISHLNSDQNRSTNTDDKGINLNLSIGRITSDKTNIEIGYNRNLIDLVNSNSTLDQNGFELSTLYFNNRDNAFALYVVGGLGALKTSGKSGFNPAYSLGMGALTDFTVIKNAKLRTEIRFQQELESSNFAHDDVLFRVGLQFPLAASQAAPLVAAPAVMAPMDSDNDGVSDDSDKCPNTPAGAAVNSDGCELDSDNDGVVNSKDECPNTPAGTPVKANGCAIDGDDDKDGVPNSKDQCPNSAPGVKIDFKGCEIKTVISLPGINFELNSSKLTASSSTTLNGAASTLKKYPEINAEVAGHTDATGADSYNMWLSEQRAASVLKYLVNKGVSVDRLTSKGYGETTPIAPNNTKEGRAKNRRVDLNVKK